MQAHPCSTHYAPCAHDLARHEAGTAMLGDFTKINFSEYVEQIMAQVDTNSGARTELGGQVAIRTNIESKQTQLKISL